MRRGEEIINQRYTQWKEKNKDGIQGINEENSKIILNYVSDMEYGLNIGKSSKKGGRSCNRLYNLQQRMVFITKKLEELYNIKDLWDVFRNFYYYDPEQKGSCSIKYVLPVMSDLDYKDLKDVKKGDQTYYQWERITFNEIDDSERLKIREALEKYCELDTLAEVEIVDRLWEVLNGKIN